MDDKRITVDLDLRNLVLEPLKQRHDIEMNHLVYAFTALGLAKGLTPLPPVRKDVLSGEVFADADIYRLVAQELGTTEPRRVAHELANAAMRYAADRVAADQELFDIFELDASGGSS